MAKATRPFSFLHFLTTSPSRPTVLHAIKGGPHRFEPQMKDIDEEGTKALQHYFASCSVIINSEAPGFEHGTGIAIRYRNQGYIVTAAHVLKGEPRNEKILIIGKPDSIQKEVEKQKIPDAFFRGTHGPIKSSTGTHITITERLENKALGDIAALKVEDVRDDLPHTVFHDLSGQGETDISKGRPVIICGFPGELALHAQHRVTGQLRVAIFTCFAWQHIMAIPESLDQLNPLNPIIDFVTDFTHDNETWDPKGMSGGGAWTIPKIKDGELWSPSQTQILGIQSGFYRNKNLLRLTRTECLLKLLSGNQHL